MLCRLYYTGEENLDEAADTGGRRVPHFGHAAGRAGTDSRGRQLSPHGAGSRGCSESLRSWQSRGCSRAIRSAIKLRILLWGLGLQFGFAVLVLKTSVGKLFQAASTAVAAMLGYSEAGSTFVFGDICSGRKLQRLASGDHFRVSGAAHHHLHRVVLRDSLLPRHHAVDREGVRDRHAEGDGGERRGIAECGRQHFYGPDGSAADDPAVSSRG